MKVCVIKGQFILSLNDRPEARKLFQWVRIETVETRYSANLRATR